MPVDMQRVILAGVKAALEESRTGNERTRRHMPAGGALLLGAGLVTAARLATSARGRGMLGTINKGLTRLQDQFVDDNEYEPEDEEDLEEYEDEDDLEEEESEDEDEEDLEE